MCHHNSHSDTHSLPVENEFNVLSQLNQQLVQNQPSLRVNNTETTLPEQDYEGFFSDYLEDGYYPNW